MKFSEYDYKRPKMEDLEERFKSLLSDFQKTDNFPAQKKVIEQINDLRVEFSSMYNLCHIRHTVNTKDPFYEKENSFFDDNGPTFEALTNEFYKVLTKSSFRSELESEFGKQLFVIAELSLKTFEPLILSDLKEENKLVTEYVKVKASAIIPFEGQDYNLSSLQPLETSNDRSTRKKAAEAKWKFFEGKYEEIEGIYDQQVKIRHSIAQKLGYKNFVELGYARMLRSDYNAEMVANFRKQVEEFIVPIATELYERQRKRIGVEQLNYYDEGFRFKSGNPKPQGDPKWIIQNAQTMYKQLSEETNHFFNFMIDSDLMDLVNKEGKATGGYCTYIDDHKAPYIFSNFNGTSADIDVLTHEAGHAFQVFSSRDVNIKEYNWPTYEACEIHSMSMEFFTWPWMNLFFGPDTEKYKYSHLSSALLFLPYGVAVDEFQHFVYENPHVSIAERNNAWKKIEQKYLPHRNYDGNAFLEAGRLWQQQNHIFSMPFYYIDYTLAQICAFQFWKRDRADHADAWSDYVKLCKVGGSKSFLDLVKLSKLKSPFETGCIQSIVGEIKSYLDSIDDSKF